MNMPIEVRDSLVTTLKKNPLKALKFGRTWSEVQVPEDGPSPEVELRKGEVAIISRQDGLDHVRVDRFHKDYGQFFTHFRVEGQSINNFTNTVLARKIRQV